MEFTYCKLIDVLSDIHSGGTPSTEESSYWGGNIKWLSSGETSQRFISDTVDKITEEGVKNSSAKLAKKNNIVMACAGQGKTRGQTSYLLDDMYINQSVIALETNASVLPLYLFYNLSSRYEELRGGSDASSTRGSITTTALKNLPFKYPDLSTQQSIVDILFGYDSLIETNNRRIELLEQTAQELYKEWFVRFRFPGYEAAKFENGLPQGWSYEKFKDELTYNTGKLDSNATVLDGEYSFYTCAKTIYKTNTYCFDGECVLLGGNNATGDFSLFYANEKLDAYQRTYIVTPQNQTLSCAYIYFVLKDYLLQFKTASIGATTKFLTKGMLDKAKILVPDEKTILRYNEIAKNMFDQIVSLKAKNENLVSQRNMLLPRLMSGKVEV
jgi:type I restriction-modification system specificity subunit (fragment)